MVRSAVVAPDGGVAYEHHVDRATRADLGVWRRDLGRGRASAAVRVLDGLPVDASYGATYATDLQVTADGRLVVASCGERACRTRVLDVATGHVAVAHGTGAPAGAVGSRLVTLAACDALPCPLEAVDLVTGTVSLLGEAAGPAVLATSGGGTAVLATAAGLGIARAMDGGGGASDVPRTAGLGPVRHGSTSGSGIEAPAGLIAVAPGGRVDDPASVQLLDPATGRLLRLDEVHP